MEQSSSELKAIEQSLEVVILTAASILEQNERYQAANELEDPDFVGLVQQQIHIEQTESFANLQKAGERIPYQDFGFLSLEAFAEAQKLEQQLAGTDSEIAQVRVKADQASRLAPAVEEKAQALASKKIEAILNNTQHERQRLESLKKRDQKLFSMFGEAWPVPQAINPYLTSTPPGGQEQTEEVKLVERPTIETTREDLPLVEINKRVMPDLLTYLSETKIFRMLDLRRDVPSIADLSVENYTKFRWNFPSIFSEIIDTKKEAGYFVQLAADPETSGKGKKYIFNVVSEPSEQANDNESPMTITPEDEIDTALFEQAKEEMTALVDTVMSSKYGIPKSLLAQKLNNGERTAEMLISINWLIGQGKIVNKGKGRHYRGMEVVGLRDKLPDGTKLSRDEIIEDLATALCSRLKLASKEHDGKRTSLI